jgi:hypothetical protein
MHMPPSQASDYKPDRSSGPFDRAISAIIRGNLTPNVAGVTPRRSAGVNGRGYETFSRVEGTFAHRNLMLWAG